MRAIVVGAGIAGPATALALERVGIGSVVLERRADEEDGSWLTLAPNGLAALRELDCLEPVRTIGVPTRRNILLSGTGRELGRIGIGSPLDDGTPALSVRRGRLAAALRAEAVHRGIDVRSRARVTAVSTESNGATVTLEDGSSLAGDLVIGADGIGSLVRSAIDPRAPRGRYVGLVNFGGITPAGAVEHRLEPEAWTMVFGGRAFFGALPTPDGDVVWFVNLPRPRVTPEERAATPDGVWLARIAEAADADASPMGALIRAGRLELAGDSTHDLPRVPTWHRGRLALVGDALHAPSPSSGQGASMALEDAVVLASTLRDAPDPSAAFAAFEAERRARVERIVRDGARSSSSKTPRGPQRALRDAMLRFVFSRVVTDSSEAWRYDYRARLDRTSAG